MNFICPFHQEISLCEQESGELVCPSCSFKLLTSGDLKIAHYPDSHPFLMSNSETEITRRKGKLRGWYRQRLAKNSVSASNFAELKSEFKDAKVLIIGGGERGIADEFAVCKSVARLDVYAGPDNNIIADAHAIPFKSETFDLIVVQAVLEHVVFPPKVIKEIWRLLKDRGVVYSEVPFLQHVHEGIFDFTRFTMTGHALLFRNFQITKFGYVGGSTTSLLWAIRGRFLNSPVNLIVQFLFRGFLLAISFFKKTSNNEAEFISANGTFILAQKSIGARGAIEGISDLKAYSGLDNDKK